MLSRFSTRFAQYAHNMARVAPAEKPQASAFSAYPVDDNVYGLTDEQKMVSSKHFLLILIQLFLAPRNRLQFGPTRTCALCC